MTSPHSQAQARFRAGDLAGAKALLEEALAAAPGHWAVHHDLGLLLRQLGDRPTAERHVRSSLTLAPAAAIGWTTAGLLEGDAGAFPRARRAIDRARLIAPDDPTSLLARAELANPGEIPAFADRIWAMLQRPDLPPQVRARLLHALGRLYDRTDDIDRAFAAISAAHAMSRAQRPYDPGEDSAFFASMTATCGADWWIRPGNEASTAVHPVFIVGMPRSGTTLLEQMLSRHPEVDAGGESLALQTVLGTELAQKLGCEFPDCLDVAGPEDWAWAARRYLELTAGRRRGATVFTDKLPVNFLMVGPILKMFPGARVLHMVRDPLDTAVSCYLTDFAQGHGFATDLDDLAHHIRLYRSLMAHWHGLGDSGLRDVSYEELVTAPEATLRAVLAHCDLPWHPDCLDFGRSSHATNTASWKRVRGPLDARRIGHWRRYAPRLGRLVGRLTSPGGGPVDVLRRSLAWEPDLAAGHVALATASTGAAASRLLRRMPALAGRDAGLLTRSATAAERIGNPELGRRLLAKAATTAPMLPAVHLNLAVAHGRSGAVDAATGSLRRALTLGPDIAEAWSNLGNFLAATSASGASAAHRFACLIAPGNRLLHCNRGLALRRLDREPGVARRSFRRAIVLAPADRAGAMALRRQEMVESHEAAGLPLLDRLRCAYPLDAEIHYERGCALRDAGRDAEAAASLRRAVALEPQHGTWRHVLDALTGGGRGSAIGYARELFDQYAESFDRHLTEGLHYRTPDALTEALGRLRPGLRSLPRVLDLGCGTGLMGAALHRGFAVEHLTGVDVSGAMLAKLREKGGYDTAIEADVHDFLEGDTGRYELVAAADVLVYLGPLERFMAGARRVLAPGGLVVLSVEETDGDRYELRRSGRYAHRRDYLEAAAGGAGLRPALIETVALREENGQPVSGLIALFVADGPRVYPPNS